ncbi:hypothetical protein RRG08_001260 [Elysia crispata]|uniref:Uncharacterized protein n=1 Tax=Elysia crispata TaxID=231223 RepID=A0AAE1EBX2_9GAST|nr:hypothetical protein RRG08_001260 [Elysia crispata]
MILHSDRVPLIGFPMQQRVSFAAGFSVQQRVSFKDFAAGFSVQQRVSFKVFAAGFSVQQRVSFKDFAAGFSVQQRVSFKDFAAGFVVQQRVSFKDFAAGFVVQQRVSLGVLPRDFDNDHGDWDFDDSIRLQRENNSLRSELHHWKSVAAQLFLNDLDIKKTLLAMLTSREHGDVFDTVGLVLSCRSIRLVCWGLIPQGRLDQVTAFTHHPYLASRSWRKISAIPQFVETPYFTNFRKK